MATAADNVPGPGQGRWTYKDYAALPEDGRRYEIVDGVLYMAPSPNRWHQKSSGRLFRYLSAHVEDTGLGEVYEAPFDVELAPGSRTVEIFVLEAGAYHSLGVFEGKATLPSRVVPGFPVRVEQFFA